MIISSIKIKLLLLIYIYIHSSISPTAGPTQGGTIITIYGSEIGHDINDIIHIIIGRNPCEPISASYIAGIIVN